MNLSEMSSRSCRLALPMLEENKFAGPGETYGHNFVRRGTFVEQ
jgi:hypothetical protein